MQLAVLSFIFFFLVLTQDVKAQLRKMSSDDKDNLSDGDTTEMDLTTYERPDWKTIDIDFLSSYYTQDGNNSPVTGGIGTEQLTDFTQKIILSIPIKEKLTLNADAGYDYYSSASTDNIDNIKSSDSAQDVRVHGNVGLTYKLDDQQSIGFRLGGSGEYDYGSVNGGLNYLWNSKDENTSVNLGLQAFIDKWSIFYPSELNGQGQLLPTDQRQSYNASIGFSHILGKRTQIAVQAEAVYMNGLLSTPFHRVFFKEQAQAKVEMLPSTRLKVPIGVRLNHYVTEWMVARLYYRYYWDDWGVQAHTASLELPLKINRFFAITPFYRYHTQSAADYFLPYKEHSVSQEFYTSDYDLAALDSHAYGIGISYQPAGGITKSKVPFTKNTFFQIKSIELKYSHYDRSTGLQADIISLGIGFSIR